MRILVAPDKFKEAATADAVAAAIARGIARAWPAAEVDLCPLADGGEGTVAALLAARGGQARTTRVTGPLGEPVEAAWAWLADGTAAIEMAAAAGLARVPTERRDPLRTTTRGVGELIAVALAAGATRVVVGMGGSATVDGGAGAVQALGVRVEPDPGRPLAGRDLQGVRVVDPATRHPALGTAEVRVACDVTSPLLGPDGAARVYGPQKGASPEAVEALARGLRHWSALAGGDPAAPGAGAAGGLAYGLAALCGARLVPGIDLVLDAVGFAARLVRADLVITGEGRLDAQSARGKVVHGVCRAAREAGVPVIALAGALGPGFEALHAEGLTAAFALAPGPETLAEALARTGAHLERLAEQVIRTVVAASVRPPSP